MPSIALKNIAAGTQNAVQGLKFEEIPAGGAFVTIYASTAVAGGNIDFSVGPEDFLNAAELNIESSADVVDIDRDKILDREPVPAGKMFLGVNAQVCNVLILIE